MTTNTRKHKIGGLARETGLSERMLRHYESLGILQPARTPRGTREYSQADADVSRLVHLFRELDVPLDIVAAVATERSGHGTGQASSRAVGSLLDDLAADLAIKAEKSLALHRVVTEARHVVRHCNGCTNRPTPSGCPDCPMNDMVENNPVAAMIWREDQE